MDTFTIYTLGGGDILWSIFNALASLLKPERGSLLTLFVSLGTTVGGTMMIWFLSFGAQFEKVVKWFFGYTILVLLVMSPTSRVHIKDTMTDHIKTVDHVPFIMAFGSSLVSSLGNGLTHVIEQAFQPSPTEMVGGLGIKGNLAPLYTETGMIFGADIVQNMKRISFDNSDLEENMHSFVNQCVTYDALLGRKYTLHDLKHATDLWQLVSHANFVGLSNMTSDMAAMSGYLCSMIPILSWMILQKGGYAFVNMASSLLGVAQGVATQSAYEKSTGNYSFGNQSFGNQQLFTANQLKHDYAPSYNAAGQMMTSDGSSSILTNSEGEKILTLQESHLPISLNVAGTQEQALRQNQRDSITFAEGEQQAGQRSQQQAHNHYLEIGKQASRMESIGSQVSDQQQVQVLQEAATHYNRVETLANKTGLSKEYVNSKVLEMNAGLGINGGIGITTASLSADIGSRINKSETSNMSANQIAEEIKKMRL